MGGRKERRRVEGSSVGVWVGGWEVEAWMGTGADGQVSGWRAQGEGGGCGGQGWRGAGGRWGGAGPGPALTRRPCASNCRGTFPAGGPTMHQPPPGPSRGV